MQWRAYYWQADEITDNGRLVVDWGSKQWVMAYQKRL